MEQGIGWVRPKLDVPLGTRLHSGRLDNSPGCKDEA